MLSSDVVQTFCYEGRCTVYTNVGHIVVLDGEQLMFVVIQQSVNFKRNDQVNCWLDDQ
jgi:hypothetical protein